MTRMTGPDCAIMCNLIHSHTHTHQSRVLTRGFRQSMVVDAGDTGVLLHLFFVNVASLKQEEGMLQRKWVYFSKAQHCHLTGEY